MTPGPHQTIPRRSYPAFLEETSYFASAAARVLADGGCAPRACDGSLALFGALEAFLLVVDGHGGRALSRDRARRALFDDRRVFLADGKHYNDVTVKRIDDFYAGVPDHLMERGVLHGAPFATITLQDQFSCGHSLQGSDMIHIISVTRRSFDLRLTIQAGAWYEEAFSGTGESARGEIVQTILRHETAHQSLHRAGASSVTRNRGDAAAIRRGLFRGSGAAAADHFVGDGVAGVRADRPRGRRAGCLTDPFEGTTSGSARSKEGGRLRGGGGDGGRPRAPRAAGRRGETVRGDGRDVDSPRGQPRMNLPGVPTRCLHREDRSL